MSSLVSEFIINPVLRQARRFSEISRATFIADDEAPSAQPDAVHDSDNADDRAADDAQESNISAEPPRARPLSSSTHETIVEEAPASPTVANDPPHDHLGFPITPPRNSTKSNGPIPEDDGMGVLRTRIKAINARDVPSSEKARLLHETLLEGYRASMAHHSQIKIDPESGSAGQTFEHSSPTGPLESFRFWQSQLVGEPSAKETFVLSEADITPTFAPIRQSKATGTATPSNSSSMLLEAHPSLGCEHYERNVKLQCSTCKKWYTCRFCHDAREDHNLIRKDTKNMLCMLCATPQKASDFCINCGEITAQYYCNICKLWENRPNKPIYHCNDCGICRRGMGLGKDFFHCKTCRACITTSIESSHKCIERSTDCDCPICGDYMFTSPKPVVFMPCGHSIHKKCYDQHMRVSYKCPICNKSLANMEYQFRNLDVAIQNQPMPPDFRDTKAKILCNDCSGRCTVPYHWLGLKCSICRSYNTVELQILSGNRQALQGGASEQLQPSIEIGSDEAAPITRPTIVSADPRVVSSVASRRRHSSIGVEASYRMPDRIVRSMSPPHMPIAPPQTTSLDINEDSEDDILGFWRGGEEDERLGGEDDFGSDEESSDGLPGADDDEEEDDDDEINIFGHR